MASENDGQQDGEDRAVPPRRSTYTPPAEGTAAYPGAVPEPTPGTASPYDGYSAPGTGFGSPPSATPPAAAGYPAPAEPYRPWAPSESASPSAASAATPAPLPGPGLGSPADSALPFSSPTTPPASFETGTAPRVSPDFQPYAGYGGHDATRPVTAAGDIPANPYDSYPAAGAPFGSSASASASAETGEAPRLPVPDSFRAGAASPATPPPAAVVPPAAQAPVAPVPPLSPYSAAEPAAPSSSPYPAPEPAAPSSSPYPAPEPAAPASYDTAAPQPWTPQDTGSAPSWPAPGQPWTTAAFGTADGAPPPSTPSVAPSAPSPSAFEDEFVQPITGFPRWSSEPATDTAAFTVAPGTYETGSLPRRPVPPIPPVTPAADAFAFGAVAPTEAVDSVHPSSPAGPVTAPAGPAAPTFAEPVIPAAPGIPSWADATSNPETASAAPASSEPPTPAAPQPSDPAWWQTPATDAPSAPDASADAFASGPVAEDLPTAATDAPAPDLGTPTFLAPVFPVAEPVAPVVPDAPSELSEAPSVFTETPVDVQPVEPVASAFPDSGIAEAPFAGAPSSWPLGAAAEPPQPEPYFAPVDDAVSAIQEADPEPTPAPFEPEPYLAPEAFVEPAVEQYTAPAAPDLFAAPVAQQPYPAPAEPEPSAAPGPPAQPVASQPEPFGAAPIAENPSGLFPWEAPEPEAGPEVPPAAAGPAVAPIGTPAEEPTAAPAEGAVERPASPAPAQAEAGGVPVFPWESSPAVEVPETVVERGPVTGTVDSSAEPAPTLSWEQLTGSTPSPSSAGPIDDEAFLEETIERPAGSPWTVPAPAQEAPPAPTAVTEQAQAPSIPPLLIEPEPFGAAAAGTPFTDPVAIVDAAYRGSVDAPSADDVPSDPLTAGPEASPAVDAELRPGALLEGEPGEPPFFVESQPLVTGPIDFAAILAGGAAAVPAAGDVVWPGAGEVSTAALAEGPTTEGGSLVELAPAATDADAAPVLFAELDDEDYIDVDDKPKPGMFSLETAGLEPTPLEQRLGRSTRMFWMWFAVSSSAISFALGALLFGLGLSLRQAVIAALAGAALSALPLALGTLAGKWSGQPTLVVGRATFGLVGNAIPSAISLLARVFWTVALIGLFGSSIVQVLDVAGYRLGLDASSQMLIVFALGFVIAVIVAYIGFHLILRLQAFFSILAGILAIGLIVLTWPAVDLPQALSTPDGSWLTVVTGAVIVFSLMGLAFTNSTSDVARYQRPSSSGAAGMTWATLGSLVPTFVLISYGALLAASDSRLAGELATDPMAAIAGLLPVWYPVPLMLAVGLSLLSGAIVSLYSAGFAVLAIGVKTSRAGGVLIAAVLIAAGLAFVAVNPLELDLFDSLVQHALFLAVPTAAWTGIFVADMMIRTRRFDSRGLLERGGSYPAVRWINLVALLLFTGIGFGLITSEVPWLSWTGYLVPLLEQAGLDLPAELTAGGTAVLLVLVLGLLTPLITGIPAVRRQEQNRRLSAGAERSSE